MTEHEAQSDGEWQALLRASAPAPPFDDVDWPALHARIMDGAAPLVRRRVPSWWHHVAGWSARGIPAAAIAAALVVLFIGDVRRPAPGAVADADFRTIEEVLAAAMPDEGMPLLLADDEVADALLFYGDE